MKFQVEIDGKTETIDVAFDSLTLRESVDVQRAVGNEEWDEFVATLNARPSLMLAVLEAKLRRRYPNVDFDQVDADFIGPGEVDPTETG